MDPSRLLLRFPNPSRPLLRFPNNRRSPLHCPDPQPPNPNSGGLLSLQRHRSTLSCDPHLPSSPKEGKGRGGEAPDRAERRPDPQQYRHRRAVVHLVLEEGPGWMERSMDGGGTLAPHIPMDDDGGGLLSVGWGAKLPDAVALDARDGLQHLDFKGRPSQWKWKDGHHGGRAGHHNGNGRMSTMAGVQASPSPSPWPPDQQAAGRIQDQAPLWASCSGSNDFPARCVCVIATEDIPQLKI